MLTDDTLVGDQDVAPGSNLEESGTLYVGYNEA